MSLLFKTNFVYFGFFKQTKSEYICTRCGKESKVVINKMIFVGFALAVAVAAGIMLYWIKSGNISNPLGVLFVAVPLVIFMLISPVFLNYVPLKNIRNPWRLKRPVWFTPKILPAT